MAKKYGIQIKGLGRALRPSGLGVLRPKPTGKGGKPLKPKPVGKKDGGMLKSVKPSQKGLSKLPKDVRNKMGYMKDGGKAKKFPDLTGDGKVTRADVLKGRGVFAAGGQARRKEKLLDKLGATDKEKEFYLIKGGDVSKEFKKKRKGKK